MPTPTSRSPSTGAPGGASTSGSRARAVVQFLFAAGLTVVAVLCGLIVWRLMHLPRPAHPAAKPDTAHAPHPAAPRRQVVVEMATPPEERPPDVLPPPLPPGEGARPVAPSRKEPDRALPRTPKSWAADRIVEQRMEVSEKQLLRELSATPELRLLSDAEVKKIREDEAAVKDPLAARWKETAARVNAARERCNAARRYLNANRNDPSAILAEREADLACRQVEREFDEVRAVTWQRRNAKRPSHQADVGHDWNLVLHQKLQQNAIRAGLVLGSGPDCDLDPTTAAEMAKLSRELRSRDFVSVPGVPPRKSSPRRRGQRREDPESAGNSRQAKVRALQGWCDARRVERMSGTVPTFTQMLQVEDEATRLLLVRELTRIEGPAATARLAERAVVDLSPAVRRDALAGLSERPASHYLSVLLRGLRYPWPPVADHAAVALRTLGPREAVAPLIYLLDLPSPTAPVLEDPATNHYVGRELVRLNHLRSCLLCHAPSVDRDDGLVRGIVPTPGEPLPRMYYEQQTGDFVRADTTYLRQDFSVNLPVKDADPWPHEQRFDFVIRQRTLKPSEVEQWQASSMEYPQRDAVLYALRGITGEDGGDSSERWRQLLGIAREEKRSSAGSGRAPAR